ncbi:MAG: hypothetical protein ACRC92_17415 [Peptostreptococcaceae bacterium]
MKKLMMLAGLGLAIGAMGIKSYADEGEIQLPTEPSINNEYSKEEYNNWIEDCLNYMDENLNLTPEQKELFNQNMRNNMTNRGCH